MLTHGATAGSHNKPGKHGKPWPPHPKHGLFGFAATQKMFDVWLMLIFGIGAFLLRIRDYPLAPAVLAIVLGPIAEPKMRQSLMLSDGDPMIFLNRPIAGPITVIALILIFLPAIKFGWDRLKRKSAE